MNSTHIFNVTSVSDDGYEKVAHKWGVYCSSSDVQLNDKALLLALAKNQIVFSLSIKTQQHIIDYFKKDEASYKYAKMAKIKY